MILPNDIKQFSVWYVNLDESKEMKDEDNNIFMEAKPIGHEQNGKRPVVVISQTHYNNKSGTG